MIKKDPGSKRDICEANVALNPVSFFIREGGREGI